VLVFSKNDIEHRWQ